MIITLTKYTPKYIEEQCRLVDEERDRRRAECFEFNGALFQCRDQDVSNLNGAVSAATLSLIMQQPAEFVWIDKDNETHTLDAQGMIALGQAAMGHVSALIFKARAIKDQIIAGNEPPDITAEGLWA